MPSYGPSDLRDELLTDRLLSIEPLLVNDRSPVEQVLTFVDRKESYRPGAPAALIATVPELCGRVFLLEDLTRIRWPAWRQFIEDLQQSTRNQPRLERLLFVAELRDTVADDLPRDVGGISILTYDSIISKTDMLAFAARLVRGRPLTRLTRAIVIELIAGLAGFDPDLARELAGLELHELLVDDSVLQTVAMRRGWTLGTEAQWSSGSAMEVDESITVHSALC